MQKCYVWEMRLNFKQVEAFQAAVRLGSATAAAEALHVTQPAVSRMIGDLERAVGFALFERRGRGLQPTADGLLLFEEVERAFQGLDRVAAAAQAIRGQRRGQLRVIALPVYGDGTFSRCLGAFLKRHPDVELALETAERDRVMEGVAARRYDIGVGSLPMPEAGVDVHPFASRRAVCVLPPDHPLAARDVVHARDLEGEQLLGQMSESPFRHYVEAALQAEGVTPRRGIRARTQWALCNLVAEGAGLALVDEEATFGFSRDEMVIRPFEPVIAWQAVVLTPAGMEPSTVTRAFLDWVREFYGRA